MNILRPQHLIRTLSSYNEKDAFMYINGLRYYVDGDEKEFVELWTFFRYLDFLSPTKALFDVVVPEKKSMVKEWFHHHLDSLSNKELGCFCALLTPNAWNIRYQQEHWYLVYGIYQVALSSSAAPLSLFQQYFKYYGVEDFDHFVMMEQLLLKLNFIGEALLVSALSPEKIQWVQNVLLLMQTYDNPTIVDLFQTIYHDDTHHDIELL